MRAALERADLVHVESGGAALSLLPYLMRCPAPIVVSLTGPDIGRLAALRPDYRELPWLLAKAKAVLTEGRRSAAIARAAGVPADRIRILPRAVDLTRIPATGPRPAAERRGELNVFLCGPLVERHGLFVALEAAGRLRPHFERLRLILAGEGPLRRPLQRFAKHWGLEGAVEFGGTPPLQRLLELAAASDLFTGPYLTASCGDREAGPPPGLLLAMAAGLPVVVTRALDIAESVEEGVSGRIVPERDPDALASAILEIAARPAHAVALGQAARRRVELRHDIGRLARRLESIYNRAVNPAGLKDCGSPC